MAKELPPDTPLADLLANAPEEPAARGALTEEQVREIVRDVIQEELRPGGALSIEVHLQTVTQAVTYSREFGLRVREAVETVIMREKRPGGLLDLNRKGST